MMKDPVLAYLAGQTTSRTESGQSVVERRMRLLECLHRTGSISQAAKSLQVSYKAAWTMVDAVNNLAEQPLVEKTVGGARGGGAPLTAEGLTFVQVYREMERRKGEILNRVLMELGSKPILGSL